jgi:uncharacterized MAPEG superfamily protein
MSFASPGPRFSRFPTSIKAAMAAAFTLSVGLWLGLFYLLPPLPGMTDQTTRLCFAVKCICVAALLCFLTGTEAVAHERLQSDAFDPLAGHESRRLRINLRYLQNTLEQLALFAPGLLALAIYCGDGRSMRAVVATTGVWILSRAAFWIGYHQGSIYRVVGLTGAAQSMVVLLYVCGRFGYELAGTAGAAAPVAIFGLIEVVLVLKTRGSAR